MVFTLGSLIFAGALVPSVLSEDKPAFASSIITAVVLAVYAVTFWTMTLWFSMAAISVTCVLWTTLAVQKYRQIKALPKSPK